MAHASYRTLHEKGLLRERADLALKRLEDCRLCPRECGKDRTRGGTGFCRTGRFARIASYGPHFGEEAPLVGAHGSGTIFFSSCNLLCTFCQNFDISHGDEGTEAEPTLLAGIMLDLAGQGCSNINFVTPSHVVPQILEALAIAAEAGLDLPLVFNTGGYDKAETLKLLDGIFDIYLPDFKFWDEEPAATFCSAPDYQETACRAIREMYSQVGDLAVDEHGVAERGLLVRHLVMPGGIAGTEGVMKFLADKVSRHTYVNIMDQYRPCHRAKGEPLISRRISMAEYEEALDAARRAGIHRLDSRPRTYRYL